MLTTALQVEFGVLRRTRSPADCSRGVAFAAPSLADGAVAPAHQAIQAKKNRRKGTIRAMNRGSARTSVSEQSTGQCATRDCPPN